MSIVTRNLHVALFVGTHFQKKLDESGKSFDQKIKTFAIPHIKISRFPKYDNSKIDQKAFLCQLDKYLGNTDIAIIVEDEVIESLDKVVIAQIVENSAHTRNRQVFSIAVMNEADKQQEELDLSQQNQKCSGRTAYEQLYSYDLGPVFPYYFCDDEAKQDKYDQTLQKALWLKWR